MNLHLLEILSHILPGNVRKSGTPSRTIKRLSAFVGQFENIGGDCLTKYAADWGLRAYAASSLDNQHRM